MLDSLIFKKCIALSSASTNLMTSFVYFAGVNRDPSCSHWHIQNPVDQGLVDKVEKNRSTIEALSKDASDVSSTSMLSIRLLMNNIPTGLKMLADSVIRAYDSRARQDSTSQVIIPVTLFSSVEESSTKNESASAKVRNSVPKVCSATTSMDSQFLDADNECRPSISVPKLTPWKDKYGMSKSKGALAEQKTLLINIDSWNEWFFKCKEKNGFFRLRNDKNQIWYIDLWVTWSVINQKNLVHFFIISN